MNREEFFRKLGDIDPEYIEEADSPAKRPVLWKKRAAAAAIFIIIAGSALSTSDSVQAAIRRLFTFIPGQTIEEQTDSVKPYVGVLYSMDQDPMTKTNGKVTVTLQNAYVDAYNVDVVYKVTLDFLTEENMKYTVSASDFNKMMEEQGKDYRIEDESREISLPKDADAMQLVLDENGVSDYIKIMDKDNRWGITYGAEATLNIAGEDYTPEYYSGGSATEMNYSAHVEYIPDVIKQYGADLPITLTVGDLSFDIKLKPIETFDSVDDIGPTDIHNNISLTAVPRWDNDVLNVKLYSLNYSEFSQVYGFIQYNDDGSRTLPYLTIGGQTIAADYDGGDGTEFYFDLSDCGFTDEEKAAAELHVPIVEVLNGEEAVIDFKVNKDGTIDFPEKVSLKYADLEITNMAAGPEIIDDFAGSRDREVSIGIEFTAVPKQDNVIFGGANFHNINGKGAGGGGSCTENNGSEWKVVFQRDGLDKLTDYHSVTISSPTYLITDEYVFSMS
ncbi:MAG: hypothetical protein PUD43_09085 [Clostridia bacterium]|nr:hypothetical protein [Clostridia bacterium]